MKKSHFLAATLASLYIAVSFVSVQAQSTGTIPGTGANCTTTPECMTGLTCQNFTCRPPTTTTTGTVQTGAPTSISGDTVCGATSDTKCNLTHLKQIISGLLTLFITVGSVLLVLFIVFRLVVAWFAFRTGSADAIKKAVNDSWQATIGFFIIFALFGGLLVFILRSFGVQTFILRLFSEAFFTHAYAQGTTILPNPLAVNNAYDLLVTIARTVIRWFVYPAIIFMWVWSGFSYVAAQGKPEAIKKAHAYVMWAAIITIAVVMTQGFIFALRGTAQRILPRTTTPTTQTTPYAGATGNAAFDACIAAGGGVGDCRTTTGTGGTNQVGTGSGRSAGVGEGGSCRVDVECTGTLVCSSGVCRSPYSVTPSPSTSGGAQQDFVITPNP